jgi:hypothetical protein
MMSKVSPRRITRSKYGTDIMYRLWDETNSCWIISNSRSIWSSQSSVEKVRDRLVTTGRDPTTLIVERVFVEIPRNRK